MMLLSKERLFDLDMQLFADAVLSIIAVVVLFGICIGVCVVIKLLIKELRKK